MITGGRYGPQEQRMIPVNSCTYKSFPIIILCTAITASGGGGVEKASISFAELCEEYLKDTVTYCEFFTHHNCSRSKNSK